MTSFSTAYATKKDAVATEVEQYAAIFDDSKEDKGNKRKENYTALVNQYYDLSTDFYEFGWGTSFHFAPRRIGEEVDASIARHEHFLALRLGLKPGMKVLDVGCGIGGPMMEIARFSGATITGVNNNAYQIQRGQQLISKYGLEKVAGFIKADFLHIPQPDNSYDAIYAIEATCHAPTKEEIYGEIFRLLKPGSLFAAYEWCMTDKYDPDNAEHREIKKNIEIGDGIGNLDTTATVLEALQKVGFEIVEVKDLAITDPINPIPWYQPLEPSFSLKGFRTTKLGIYCTSLFVYTLERIGLAPKGVTQAHSILMTAHNGLVRGGKSGIFTPMYYFLVRKPAK